MKRRDFITLLGGAGAYPLIAQAQQNKMPVVGALSSLSVPAPWGPYRREAWSGFLKGLDDTGFFAATDIAFERRPSEAEQSAAAVAGLPAMAADLVRHKVDVIVAFGSAEARAAKSATATIPIVFESGDPIADGLVSSLARPDRNLTGVSLIDAELMPKRLQLLSELVPAVRVFALLVNPNSTSAATVTGKTRDAARAKGIELHILRASTLDELDTALEALGRIHAGGLIVDSDRFFYTEGGNGVAKPASAYAIPAIYGWSEIIRSGGLMSYGPNLTAARRQMGNYTGRILKGEKPADLPVEQVTEFELVINLKTAKALGLTVPQSLLARADKVIQ